MASVNDKILLIQTMTTLLDELSAPDLTIARANVLRPQLASLMELLHDAEAAGARSRHATAPAAAPNHPLSDLLPFPTPISLRSVG